MGRHEFSYDPIDVDSIVSIIGDRIMVKWEENTKFLAKGKLVRPDTHKKQYYTGIVLKCGPAVNPEIEEGQRILFDQFSNFDKFWDEKHGRVAILEESRQGPAFALIPKRMEIDSEEKMPVFDDKRTDLYL